MTVHSPTPNFNQLHILGLESRMATSLQRLIEKYQGVAHMAPSVRELPVEDVSPAFQLFEDIQKGRFDLLILMTGVGLRAFLKVLETRYSKDEILSGLQKTKVVVRGPKPTSVCKIFGIPIAITVPPPNTWQEILKILESENLLDQKNIALLEYGQRNSDFLAQLESRGACVSPIAVYSWALPEDTGPLRQALSDIIAGKIDMLLQTSAVQIDHFLQMIKNPWEELALRRALAKVLIVSIGPATSARLEELQIFVDLEVFPNKLENLVEQAAILGPDLLRKKRARAEKNWVRISPEAEMKIDSATLVTPTIEESAFLRACRRQPADHIPIWLMRQAGRYMTEYQLIRRGKNFLDFCKDPDLCTEATLGAAERLGVDAAIIFSDILLILEAMGADLVFHEAEGPQIRTPIRDLEAIRKLRPVQPEESLGFVLRAIRQTRAAMQPKIPLIGFCGAPFTLASYLIEGRGSRNYIPTKTLMYTQAEAWDLLMSKLVEALIPYLHAQVEAGCQVLQIFDSWVGCLSPSDYERFVLPYTQRLFQALPAEIPKIHFGTGTATLLSLQKQAGGDVLGLDWRVDVSSTWEALGDVAIQGNLDPVVLFSPLEVIRAEASKILESVGDKPGFIFNLGHGILPETPVDHVMALVDFVQGWRRN